MRLSKAQTAVNSDPKHNRIFWRATNDATRHDLTGIYASREAAQAKIDECAASYASWDLSGYKPRALLCTKKKRFVVRYMPGCECPVKVWQTVDNWQELTV